MLPACSLTPDAGVIRLSIPHHSRSGTIPGGIVRLIWAYFCGQHHAHAVDLKASLCVGSVLSVVRSYPRVRRDT